jgi:hypothetical protein
MFGDTKGSLNQSRKHLAEFFSRQIGEKSQPAKVDPKHGQLTIAHLSYRAQDRSIAPEHNRQIRFDSAQILLLDQIDEDNFHMLPQERKQNFSLCQNARSLGVAQDDDATHEEFLPLPLRSPPELL